MKNISSKVRLLPLLFVGLYAATTLLFNFGLQLKLILLVVMLLASSAAMLYLYKIKQIAKDKVVFYIVFAGLIIVLMVGMYFYTTRV